MSSYRVERVDIDGNGHYEIGLICTEILPMRGEAPLRIRLTGWGESVAKKFADHMKFFDITIKDIPRLPEKKEGPKESATVFRSLRGESPYTFDNLGITHACVGSVTPHGSIYWTECQKDVTANRVFYTENPTISCKTCREKSKRHF